MKNLTAILLICVFLILTNYSIAQKFKYQKISTDVKKESKKYEKEGWNNFPGSMPIGQQLNNTFNKQNKIDLVQQVESDIKSFAETNLANNQLSKDEAASITKTVNVVTNKVAQKLGRVIPLLRIYKETPNNFEVQVQVGYNIASAKKIMLEEVKKELGNDADKIKEKLGSFLYSEKQN